MSALIIDGDLVRLRPEQLEAPIREHLLQRAMQKIEVKREELARARVMFAADMRLQDEASLLAWLAQRGMDEAQLEEELARIIAFGKLKEEVAGAHIEEYFEAHRADFESVILSRIVTREPARVLAALDLGASFEELAIQHSTDPKTRMLGGWLGRVRRRDLPVEEATLVFSTAVPSIVGPVGFSILKVERIFPAQLDQPTRAEIHEHLFSSWLARERAQSIVEVQS